MFSCTSLFLNNTSQREISKYLFCKDFNIPPSSGSYEHQPYKTLQKFNIIKSAIAKLQEVEQEKMQKKKGS